MLEVQKQAESRHTIIIIDGEKKNQSDAIEEVDECNDLKLFKPRLIAVLLEYGEKGIHLSNIPKVWEKVWPNDPFPLIKEEEKKNAKQDDCKRKGKRKKGQLLRLIESRCGDFITVIRDQDTGILIKPRNVSRKDVAQCVTEQIGTLSI